MIARDSQHFPVGLFSNRFLLVGIASEMLMGLFIIYHPWGQAFFGTAPLSFWVWAVLAPFAAVLLLAEESRKFIARRGLT